MKSIDLASEIAALETERAQMTKRLEALIGDAQPHLAAASAEWVKRGVDGAINTHPEHVLELGHNRLRELKARISKLITSLPEITRKELSSSRRWPHNCDDGSNGYDQRHKESFFDGAFRNVISHLGSVLNDFGLLVEPKGSYSCWERIVGEDSFRYRINTGFETSSVDPIRQYAVLFQEYRQLVRRIKAKTATMAQEQANELWKEA